MAGSIAYKGKGNSMMVYLTEVEYGRLEPKADNLHRYEFERLIEVDTETVERWKKAITDYDAAQNEMNQIHGLMGV